jgi:hypothetical protein
MRPAAALAALSCLLLVGCGGSDGTTATTVPGGDETLEQLWREPGDDVAVVPGTESYEPGEVRVSFLVVDAEGRPVTLPTARVWVADALDRAPFLETEAKIERIGVLGGAVADTTHFYVARFRIRHPGKYWLLAEPQGGATKVQALGNVVVVKDDAPPDVGDPAPASATPTLASTHGDLSALTTRTPPDTTLLRYSVASSLRRHAPFVVTFATPKYCSSRVCGPVVDVVEDVAKRYTEQGVRFIHVEVYEGNDPANGFNRWVREWRLPTEPWTFLVNGAGIIVARFEGSVSVDELEAAVREKLTNGG